MLIEPLKSKRQKSETLSDADRRVLMAAQIFHRRRVTLIRDPGPAISRLGDVGRLAAMLGILRRSVSGGPA
ncbi:MAG: hypothetical protein SH850_31050 [Planctomycetaceae bacterium]|nr:hypothetical protein [Planctomycetaceae bacterium]